MVHVDTELYHQRRRNGNNGNGKGWQRLPWSAIVSVLLAIIGWIIASVFWGVRQDERMRVLEIGVSRIEAHLATHSNQIEDFNRRIGILDERYTAAVTRNNAQDERMERMEAQGTRRLPIIEERQQQVLRRLDAITQYLQQNSNFKLQSEPFRPAEPGRRD